VLHRESAKLMEQAGRLQGMAAMAEAAPGAVDVENLVAGMRAIATEIEAVCRGYKPPPPLRQP
jgi:hypothetical protein